MEGALASLTLTGRVHLRNPLQPPSSSSPESTTQDPALRRIAGLLTIIVVAILLTFGYFASSLFLTLILAGFLAILLDPLVELLERWHIHRPLGAALVILSGLLFFAVGVALTYNKAVDFTDDLPEYTEKVRTVLYPVIAKIQHVEDTAGKLNAETHAPKRVPEVKVQQSPQWPSYVARGVSSVWGALVIAGVVPVLMFFMLVRKRQMYARFESWIGKRTDFPRFVSKLSVMIRSFVIGNLIIGSVLAACVTAVLFGIGLRGALVIGILTGFLNLIPYLGLVLGLAVPILAALLQFNTVAPFLIIVAAVTSLHLIANNIAIPRFIGSRVDVGPVAATIGILFWGWLWGGVGLLLAIPLTAFIKLIAESHPALTPLAQFLSESARPVPSWAQPGAAPWARVQEYVRSSMRRKPGEKHSPSP